MSSDLFQDGGVIKTILRQSTEAARPKQGDEVSLVYHIVSEAESRSHNLTYTVGVANGNLFIPLRTMDRIVCDMKRNEKCNVRVTPTYSGKTDVLEAEITLISIRASAASQSGGLQSLSGPLGDFQGHLLRNPDVMDQMMSSPQMQSILSNPETMRSILGMNPQMQEMMRQNPELNGLLNDPEFLQQTMEAMRNPNVMREMMRNTDRAMSNIESIPGGTAALHKLYNEVQAPLFEASQGSSQVSKIKDDKQLKAKYGDLAKPDRPISEPLSNPWSSAPPTRMPVPTVPQGRSGPVDLSGMSQMMQDPSFQQLMGSMMNQGQGSNPLANPATLQSMFNPTTMQAMGRLEQSLASMRGGPMSNPPGGFNQLFGNFLNVSQVDPQVRYREQLARLRDMGFTDIQAAIKALDDNNGDVDEAAVQLANELEQVQSRGSNNL